MSQNDIYEVELSIKQAKEMVEMARAVERLHANADFKRVFTEHYFEREAIRLVHLKSDPSMQDEKSQDMIMKSMDAIGSLQGYLRWISQQGDMALKAIEEGEEILDEMRAEEAE